MTFTPVPWHVRAARKYGQTAVLYAALALSAPGEYKLALMAGWDPSVAWLMPAVLSLYAAISASIAKAYKTTAREAAGTPHEAEAKRRSKNATVGALLALLMATAAQITEHVITATVFGPTLWVIVVVSAVPPLVAAHVLHIDPPLELNGSEGVNEEHETPAEEPQEAAEEPEADPEAQLPDPPAEVPYEPVLVTYAEAAEAVGLSEISVRGAANDGRLTKYEGDVPRRVYVDMRECHTVFAKSRQRAGV
ncbi:DNA-binding protein OS=Streptomyces microflavus OX=1919 GN=Smic_80580 PE=4 SV=1 [Streptomyces microflavus]